jgi:hypothetical protein
MPKPYLKKYSIIPPFTVWIVDGQYVRTHLGEEFTNFGAHYRFQFIPKNEFWIDREINDGEEQFYIDIMLTMYRAIKSGKTHAQAVALADKVEARERHKSDLFKKIQPMIQHKKEILQKIHKQFLRSLSGGVKVWIVDGELVRDLFYLDFTEGGHDKVYCFVPTGEVWIDDDVAPKERKCILIHELHERRRMAQGWDYAKAHYASSRLECYCRYHPDRLDAKLQEEIKKNASK